MEAVLRVAMMMVPILPAVQQVGAVGDVLACANKLVR